LGETYLRITCLSYKSIPCRCEMSAILPGYTYDIFISYRQKDNKYDGWVTEFVDHLKRELEATFKEDISVYFDENPHDGLRETHIVDKSLQDKLKCLVFIPIISRTYCDPNSFAWQHEFIAFNKLAKEDSFGRDVKIFNGNVASRILPVKIHDIDREDKSLLENELNGTLRAIDFTYKSAGVNRSLKPDDNRSENQNHTYYRDQINKVANAIKEVIQVMKKPVESQNNLHSGGHVNSFNKQGDAPAKRIAILPFTDMSPARDQEYLGDGLAEAILTLLSRVKELRVTGRTSSFSFKNKNIDLRSIGEALSVEYILEGSIQKVGNRIRITAQLINAADGYHVWSQRYDREMDDIFELQDDICSRITENLKLTLLKDHITAVRKRSTNNHKAYELYLKGDFYCRKYRQEGFEQADAYFEKAVKLDPNFTDAWWYMGFVNYEMHGWLMLKKERIEKAIYCAEKAISIDETCADAHFLQALINFTYNYDWEKVRKDIELGNRYTYTPFPLFFLPLEAWYRVMILGDIDFAMKRMQKGVESDPLNTYYQYHLAQIYLYGIHDYNKTISIVNCLLELDFPKDTGWRTLCLSYLFEGNYAQALEYAQKDFSASEGTGHGAANLIMCLAASGRQDEAQNLYKHVTETLSFSQFPEILHVKANEYLGDFDRAFEYLDKAIEANNYWLYTFKRSPEWDLLRSDPRFDKVLDRLKFPK
jgi:adenylate cyclase